MKALFLFFCICIVTSCTSQYEFEDKIYQCTKETYQTAGVNSDQLLNEFENYFLEKKYLKNTSTDSYALLIESILPPNQLQFSIPKDLENKLMALPMMNQNCTALNVDSVELGQSRFYEVIQDISKNYQIISKTGNLDSENFFKKMLHVFKKEDFEHPLFKIIFYHLLSAHSSMNKHFEENKGVLTQLPPWPKDEPDLTKLQERNVYTVKVNSKDEIFARGKRIKSTDLKNQVKEFISNPNQNIELAEYSYKAVISLKNDRGTTYKVYIDVLNEIKAAYNELRNEKAMELYNQPYERLEKTKQKEIRMKIPLIISESEPTSYGEEG